MHTSATFHHTRPVMRALTLAIATALCSNAQAALFVNHIENGIFNQPNGVGHSFQNNLTVNGTWNLLGAGNDTDMLFTGTQTLGGTGAVVMSDNTANRIFTLNGQTLTIDLGMTVRGAGQLGANSGNYINNGSVLAQGTNTLTIDANSTFTNNNLVRAEGTGGVVITGTTFNNNTGAVTVNNTSNLTITSATVNGGTLNNSLGGTMNANNVTFNGVTVNGAMKQANGHGNTITGGLTLNGTWNQQAAGNNTDLLFAGSQTLGGTGAVVMGDNTANRVLTFNGQTLTIGATSTVRGAGQLGANSGNYVNDGEVLAQGANALTIDANSTFTNNNVLRAEGTGGLVITGTTFNNNSAVDVNNGSSLTLTSNTVNGGTLNNNLGGTMTANNVTFNGVTVNGVMDQANGHSNTINNGMTLNGTWNLRSAGNNTDLLFGGSQTLGGTGEVVMSDDTANRVFTFNGQTLTIGANSTIRGAGQIGANSGNYINNGEVLAQGSKSLTIDANSTFTNNGVLRAEGSGGLVITGTTFNNNNAVDVNNGSNLTLNVNTLNGGVLNNAAGGTMSAVSNTFNGVTVNGVMDQANGTSNTFNNDLTLNGTWNLQSSGTDTDMVFAGNQSITGNADIVTSDNASNRIFTFNGQTLTIDTNTTIRGAGQLGANSGNYINNGTVLAQGAQALTIDANNAFTNNGVLRAEGTGGLVIQNSTLNNNSSVDVNNGSSLTLSGLAINGGTFNNTLGGTMTAQSNTFNGVTVNGAMTQANGTTNTVNNGLTNNGTWNMSAGASNTDMHFSGNQTLGGNGEVVMNSANNRIFTFNGQTLTIGANQTIRGSGQIGANSGNYINNGTVTADAATAMTIDANSTFQNNGNLNATGSGGIIIGAGNFNNAGNVTVNNGSSINRAGTYIQTAGETNVNGALTASGLVDIQGGVLTGDGTINANVTNSGGTVGPGNSPGSLFINGDFTQLATGTLAIELAGTTPGTEFDVLNVFGTANLAGALDVDLFGGYLPTVGDTFDILTAEVINGTFSVLNLTLGTGATWSVDYLTDINGGTTDVVRLTLLTAPTVPLPAAVWLFGSGLIALFGLSRRRQAA